MLRFSGMRHTVIAWLVNSATGRGMLIFLPIFAVLLAIGPRWFYPWLPRQAHFPDEYRKSQVFASGLLPALALALYFRQYRAASSYVSQVHQFSQSIGARVADACTRLPARARCGVVWCYKCRSRFRISLPC